MVAAADRQGTELGIRSLLPVSAVGEALSLELYAGISDLHGIGEEFADHADEEDEPGKARAND